MLGKIAGTVGFLALVGLSGQTLVLTGKLAALNSALGQNLIQVRQLVAVQNTMLVRNRALPKTLAVTQDLAGTLVHANAMSGHIEGETLLLGQINSRTLAENQGIDVASGAAATYAGDIGTKLKGLSDQTQQLSSLLNQLRQVAAGEQAQLTTILQNTQTLEAKTP